jgi:hypothetical protein
MLLMTRNTRSGAVSQGRPKGAALAVGAKRRALTDGAAEGTRATFHPRATGLCLLLLSLSSASSLRLRNPLLAGKQLSTARIQLYTEAS